MDVVWLDGWLAGPEEGRVEGGGRVPTVMAPQYFLVDGGRNRQKIRQPTTTTTMEPNKKHDWCWTLIIMTAFRRVLCLRPMDNNNAAQIASFMLFVGAPLPACLACQPVSGDVRYGRRLHT